MRAFKAPPIAGTSRPGRAGVARAAVHAGRPVVEGTASSLRPEEAVPARRPLRVMDGTPPFPRL
ncbi:hypothetical protein [Streptomyces sp. NPDC088557]|uniref:hypothetical protein n=1 Tax=Streptomyces sp. NPDC088557 TaxID=3365867 RepID=UPI00383071C9